MNVNEAKRLRELEVENTRLKRLLAEAELDKAMLKELGSGTSEPGAWVSTWLTPSVPRRVTARWRSSHSRAATTEASWAARTSACTHESGERDQSTDTDLAAEKSHWAARAGRGEPALSTGAGRLQRLAWRPVPQNTFDERVAPTYDADSRNMFAPEVLGPAVDLLAELARDGAALELAIGTGRVALPLSRHGVEVHGIDISTHMVEQLRAKPGGHAIPVTIGDMATTTFDRTFQLAYVVFNTITNLTTQDEQVQCFRNVARHLEPGGRFLIEVFVPELRRLPPGDAYRAFLVTPTHLGVDEYDVVANICRSNHWFVRDGELQVFVSTHRYVWPAEMDLMARMAGLELEGRWGGWQKEPYTAESTNTVSVWRKVA